MRTIDDYKIQNDEYWTIIEKQRLIIKTMQKSLNQLTNENEMLARRNKELESSFKNMSNSTLHPLSTETPIATSIATATASISTPVVPPRSPFRINHNHSNHPLDTNNDLPKRPPVLKLAMSNHAHFQNREADQSTSTTKKARSKVQHKRNHSQTSSQHSNSTNDNLNIPAMSKSKSEPSTPAHPRTPRYDSLHNINQLDSHVASPTTATAILRNLSNINVKIIASINTSEKGFIIGILQKEDGREIWRIEKSLSDLISLDSNLKSLNPALASTLKKLPDKSLFATHAPTKVDERKSMAQDYLQHAITLKSINNDILCEFLSTDRIHNLSITLTNDAGTKEGYLTKKGKNFGGWKSRYFMLDHSGILRYYETKNGTFLGNINLINSQIASQPQYESNHESHFRHAFLIVEPKLNGGSPSKHIFCADSDAERDSWVDALRFYTNQLHITEDIINSSFATDESMTIDHLVVEPSSSTESNKSSILKKRPSIDYILNYFQQTNSSRRRSSTSKASSPTTSADSSSVDTLPTTINPPATIEEQSEEHIGKARHKSNRKTFWGKKMFGSHMENPISPHSLTFGTSDYEETCGPNQIFGIPLENAVNVSRVCEHYDLPAIIHRCIEYLEARDALIEEGIYRLSGSSVKVKTLKKRFNDAGDVKLLEDEEFHDVHAIAGLLKMWLRELPENILTEALLGDFLNSIHLDKEQSKICEVGRLITTLPLANYTLLRSLCAHLIRVIENSDKNKMTLKNISIVFSATLGIPSSIFNMLLKNFDYIFWTDRCEDQQVTEDTIKIYMAEEDVSHNEHNLHQHPHDIINPVMKRVIESSYQGGYSDNGRSRRNSIHYKDNTPKEFISLEKQLDAVLDDSSQLDDDIYYSDGELEVAYFASRYNANSKTSNHLASTEYVQAAI
ncbi:hypothetical protein HMPREF1544_04462 [Mucor circinelloides 1006PhL]|uniref:RalA-binding protein 1 n=1 Tax=Mucor circinelloides f. circinelloides (strain 1006PhL) TaxID=1220926 RepID=S2K0L6_MUCC1|nr:hypothetical protein HMPREF1544_04462 [Mucor circinelloides 1006PhL]